MLHKPTRRGLVTGGAALAAMRALEAHGQGLPGIMPGAGLFGGVQTLQGAFDPSTKGTYAYLQDANRTLGGTNSGGYGSARWTLGTPAAGKFYVEFSLLNTSGALAYVGLCDGSSSMSNYIGADSASVGWAPANHNILRGASVAADTTPARITGIFGIGWEVATGAFSVWQNGSLITSVTHTIAAGYYLAASASAATLTAVTILAKPTYLPVGFKYWGNW